MGHSLFEVFCISSTLQLKLVKSKIIKSLTSVTFQKYSGPVGFHHSKTNIHILFQAVVKSC